jgi:hypothetical protein
VVCALGAVAPVGAGAARVPRNAPELTTLHFQAPFVPMQLTAAAGRVWVLGSRSPGLLTDCGLEAITPTTMATRSYPLPACPTGLAALDGQVYLMMSDFVPGTAASRQMRLAVFDPATGQTRALAPVVMTIVGSGIAHTAFEAGDGALWLYGYQMGAGAQVVRIAPQNGMVTATVTDPPEIGGVFPTAAANEAGLWLGGGPGGSPAIEWVHNPPGQGTTVSSGPNLSATLWVSAVGDTVWAGIIDYGAGKRPSVRTHLVAVNRMGKVVVRSATELTGDYPLVSTRGGHLWSMSWPRRCGGAYELVEVDAATGSSHPSEPLQAPPEACNDADTGSQVAAVGLDVFALIPAGPSGTSVLYRAAT